MLEMPQPHPPADEPRETREKRLKMRSMRRGIKEMDLILQAYAEDRVAAMSEADLDLYDALLNENDHDLYQWVTGQTAGKDQYADLVDDIRAHIASSRG